MTGASVVANDNSASEANRPASDSTSEAANKSAEMIDVAFDSQERDKLETMQKIAPRQLQVSQEVDNEIKYVALGSVNDPLVQGAWYMSAVNANSAWDYIDSSHAIVAVLDSGFALSHEDLSGQWAENDGEKGMTQAGDTCWTGVSVSKQSNSCDDDGNGYSDDWRGWDFVYTDNDPVAGSHSATGNGVAHGTKVAGLVGARANNSKGAAAVGYNNRIMPLQVMADSGLGYTSDIASAVYYATDNGADVINLSLGGADEDPFLEEALQYAYDNNVIVVVAAGNCGAYVEDGVCDRMPVGAITFPARYDMVISVGASAQEGTRASFSSYGPRLDVVAPGSGTIKSTTWSASNPTSLYASSLYGTSFAAPMVASIAGGLKSIDESISPAIAKAMLVANSTRTGAMSGQNYTEELGHGVVNAYRAFTLPNILALDSANISLSQVGNYRFESRYTHDRMVSSGCDSNDFSWCSVWFRSDFGFDRYLPFKEVQSGSASWSWNTSMLGRGVWDVRAINGGYLSEKRTIFSK